MDVPADPHLDFSRSIFRRWRIPAGLMAVCLLMWTLAAAPSSADALQRKTAAMAPAVATQDPPPQPTAQAAPRHLDVQSRKAYTLDKRRAKYINTAVKQKAENITSEISQALPERMEQEIKKYFGLRYKLGGSGLNGIDCSTLTRKVYADVFGIDLPHNSKGQSRTDKMENVDSDELQTGDLVFFGPKRKRVNHVGIYLAGGYFVHAICTKGVTISRIDSNYWKSRWMLSKRIKPSTDDYLSINDEDLERILEQFSLGLVYAGDNTPKEIRFFDSGLQLNSISEVRLSALYKQELNPSIYATDSMPLSLQSPSMPNDDESRLRLSAAISPLSRIGFKLIPSITQIVNGRDSAGHTPETQTLGLETWMIMPSTGLALFMGAQANTREDLLRWPLKMTLDWRTLDVSLGIYYRLSKDLRFSVLGTHALNSTYEEANRRQQRPWLMLEDISFKISYQF